MSQSIKLLTDEDALHWPKLCARCGAAEPLRSGEALIAATRSARQNPGGGISMGSDVLSVDYPVCDRHAKFLSLAQWLTRDTLAPLVVRGFCYAIGSASLLALGIKLLALKPELTRDKKKHDVCFYAEIGTEIRCDISVSESGPPASAKASNRSSVRKVSSTRAFGSATPCSRA